MIKLFDILPSDASRQQREALRDVVEAIESAHRHHCTADEIEDIASIFVESRIASEFGAAWLHRSMPESDRIEAEAASLGRAAVADLRNVGAWDRDWGDVDSVTARVVRGSVSLAVAGELWRRRAARQVTALRAGGTITG